MSEPESSDRLRHGALAMLADGNSVEAVAQVFRVPPDAVLAWRAQGQAPAACPAPRATPPADLPPRPALPAGSRGLILLICCGMAVACGWFAISSVRGGHVAHGLQALVMMLPFVVLPWRFVARDLVLGRDGVSAQEFLGRRTLAYADVADYRLHADREFIGRGSRTGQTLTILSRTPGVKPLTAFLADDNEVDARLLFRLGDVVRANRAAAAAVEHESPEAGGNGPAPVGGDRQA